MSIKVSDVFFSYNKKSLNKTEALNGVFLTINKGTFNAVVGKTGSGKSTLMQTFNALLIPDKGTIDIDSFKIQPKKTKNIKKLRKHIGVVFQFPEYQLFEETVEKDVAFGLKNFGFSEEESLKKARETLISLGLNETYFKRSPFDLSGGEKRRVAIAGILSFDPDILILDEPTAGLDATGKRTLINLLKLMHDSGKTIIVVTHDMNVVLECCDNVFVMKDGKVCFSGTPFELFSHSVEEFDIKVPELFKLGLELKKRRIDIDLSAIKTIDDMAVQIKKWSNK